MSCQVPDAWRLRSGAAVWLVATDPPAREFWKHDTLAGRPADLVIDGDERAHDVAVVTTGEPSR
jgi:hypothetical protein